MPPCSPTCRPATSRSARRRHGGCCARSQSARCVAAYLYAAAGAGESTTDLAWDGQASIFENGATLAETERFPSASQFAIADIDLDLLRHERMQMGSFDTNRRRHPDVIPPHRLPGWIRRHGDIGLERKVERYPFVPADPARLEQDCYEAYNIQVSGLAQRLRAIGIKRVVIGVSGGLDSTHALIVCSRALDLLGLPRGNILAYTMPGFATSAHTKANAIRLMEALGVDLAGARYPARRAKRMLADIGHPFAQGEPVYDLTFENVQAGLRTDYLFRLANHHDGIVIGTGDLSELALGWCTYGVGDQMAHYNVNAGVPKTLIQHLIRWVIGSRQFEADVGYDAGRDPRHRDHAGAGADQGRRDAAEHRGVYRPLRAAGLQPVLHAAPRLRAVEDRLPRAARLGRCGEAATGRPAFPEIGAAPTTWRRSANGWRCSCAASSRFSQFKRSAMPNGPKVSAGGSLSPRGDWRAPSDGNANAWLAELERNVPKELTRARLGRACAPRAFVDTVERSEMRQDQFGLADLEAARCLDGEMRHLAVLRDQCVALAAGAHAAAHQVEFEARAPW